MSDLYLAVAVLTGLSVGFIIAFRRFVNRMNTEVVDVI